MEPSLSLLTGKFFRTVPSVAGETMSADFTLNAKKRRNWPPLTRRALRSFAKRDLAEQAFHTDPHAEVRPRTQVSPKVHLLLHFCDRSLGLGDRGVEVGHFDSVRIENRLAVTENVKMAANPVSFGPANSPPRKSGF
jgi:hypothetical protein